MKQKRTKYPSHNKAAWALPTAMTSCSTGSWLNAAGERGAREVGYLGKGVELTAHNPSTPSFFYAFSSGKVVCSSVTQSDK